MTAAPNTRGCYCKPGELFCGTCERCGAPGHTRHFPGPVPYTGSWCDRCYRVVGLTWALKHWGPVILVAAVVVTLARACST